MPQNSTGTIAVWKDATNVDTFDLSPQDTGVRVRQVKTPTEIKLPGVPPSDGDSYEIVDADGSANAINQILVVPPAGTTIRGAANFPIVSPFGSAVVTFDSSADDWVVTAGDGAGAGFSGLIVTACTTISPG